MPEYRLVDFTEVPDVALQVADVSNAAFAEYEGAPTIDAAFAEWYLRRPGSTLELCVGALDGETLASMVLVALQPVQLGGRVLSCGIIDSVATHPEHRKQGLARLLMDMAHQRMRQAGADAGVLYTNPEDHPYQFYGRLGYQTRAMCMMMRGTRPLDRELPVREAEPVEYQGLASLIDGFYEAHEGYAPLSEELWAWHKLDRPAGLEARVMVTEVNGVAAGTCTWSRIELLLGGETKRVAAMVDFACIGDVCPGPTALQSLMASAPEEDIVVLVDTADPLADLYGGAGFERVVGEVSMVLPFSQSAHAAMASRSGPWYVMAESVIGV